MSDTNRKLIEDVLGPQALQGPGDPAPDGPWLAVADPLAVHESVSSKLRAMAPYMPGSAEAGWAPGTMVQWAEGHRAGPDAAMWFVRRLFATDPADASVVQEAARGGYNSVRAMPYPDALVVLPDQDGDLNAYIVTSMARLQAVHCPQEQERLVAALQAYTKTNG